MRAVHQAREALALWCRRAEGFGRRKPSIVAIVLVVIGGGPAAGASYAAGGGPLRWPNSPPRGIPFARSQHWAGVLFTGPYANYTAADTFYPSWGADGRLYSSFMDGDCNASVAAGFRPTTRMGTAVIAGNSPGHLSLRCATVSADTGDFDGRYASASLDYKGIWYYGSYLVNDGPQPGGEPCLGYCTLGPFVGWNVSRDGGSTWSSRPASPLFGESIADGRRIQLGALHVVDFGRNMRSSPDGRAYLVGHGARRPTANNGWVGGDDIYLIRVRPSPSSINSPGAYDYYTGSRGGHARWSRRFSDLRPLLSWPGHLGSTTITYDAPLKTYLMWVTAPSDGVNDLGPYDSMLLEASTITGPWRLIHYLPRFGPQAYFLNVPSKFISADGREMWLSYSANWVSPSLATLGPPSPVGSTYSWVLRKLHLVPRPTGTRRSRP